MNMKNNVFVDVLLFLLFEVFVDFEICEEGGYVGYDDKDYGNDVELMS